MAVSSSENDRIFSFVFGRHHSPATWDLVRDNLSSLGWDSIAPDFWIENPDVSLDEHAERLKRAEDNTSASEIYRVGWSWGANVIPRAAGSAAVKKLIFTAGAFHPATLRHKVKSRPVPESKHSLIWEAMRTNPLRTAREVAPYALYNDVESVPRLNEIISSLRQHPRRELEPGLVHFPDLPMEYILMTNDRTLLPESQREIAEALGIVPVEFDGGHAAMYSEEKAKKLARLYIHLANKN